MSIIAQGQCRAIVIPKTSEEKGSSSRIDNSSKNTNTKLPQIIKNGPPRTFGSSLKRLKSGATILKGLKSGANIKKSKIADSKINTLVSGPLRCDNNCFKSYIGKCYQHDQVTCKCWQNKEFKVTAKETQTLSNIFRPYTDKAPARHVDTASCGIQYLENERRKLEEYILGKNSKTLIKLPAQCSCDSHFYEYFIQGSSSNQSGGSMKLKPRKGYIGSKRWALTNYPTRGPDF